MQPSLSCPSSNRIHPSRRHPATANRRRQHYSSRDTLSNVTLQNGRREEETEEGKEAAPATDGDKDKKEAKDGAEKKAPEAKK